MREDFFKAVMSMAPILCRCTEMQIRLPIKMIRGLLAGLFQKCAACKTQTSAGAMSPNSTRLIWCIIPDPCNLPKHQHVALC